MREEMPARRNSHSIEVNHLWDPNTEKQRWEFCRVTYSTLADGQRIGEVFITYDQGLGKGSFQEKMSEDVGKLISIALQYGAPLEVLRDTMGFSPVDMMGKPQMMPHSVVGSILEALAKEQGLPPMSPPRGRDPVAW